MISRISVALLTFAVGYACVASGTALISGVSQSGDVSIHYGLIVTRYYPGPPNYDSTSKQEKVKALLIGSSDNRAEQRLIQLYFSPDQPALAECAKSGCRACVSGRLFEAESGHHHTAQILEVTKVELDAACVANPQVAQSHTPSHSLNRTHCGTRPIGKKRRTPFAEPAFCGRPRLELYFILAQTHPATKFRPAQTLGLAVDKLRTTQVG